MKLARAKRLKLEAAAKRALRRGDRGRADALGLNWRSGQERQELVEEHEQLTPVGSGGLEDAIDQPHSQQFCDGRLDRFIAAIVEPAAQPSLEYEAALAGAVGRQQLESEARSRLKALDPLDQIAGHQQALREATHELGAGHGLDQRQLMGGGELAQKTQGALVEAASQVHRRAANRADRTTTARPGEWRSARLTRYLPARFSETLAAHATESV